MEPKKRPLSENEDSAVTKKRILTGANGDPHVNGVSPDRDEDEPQNGDNLELFRKEAIYRRMKHYSRENERSQSRIAELERRKNTCEAGLAAMSACWSQLVEAIRHLVKPEDLPQADINTSELFDLSIHIPEDRAPELAAALGDTVNITRTLVDRFVELGESSGSTLLQNSSYADSQKSRNECIALQSEINVMRAKLQDCQSQRDRYHAALMAAENHLERARSGTVLAMEARMTVESKEPQSEETEELQRKPSSPAHPPPEPSLSNGIQNNAELDALNEMCRSRETKIQELEREAAILRDEKTLLELQLKSPATSFISSLPQYKMLIQHLSHLESTVTEFRSQNTRLSDDLQQLHLSRREWESNVQVAAGQAVQEIRGMLVRRDADLARLREQREQLAAEINERKKDNVKFSSLQEFKTLAEFRLERIGVLESEVKRCKSQLAANAGAKDIMLFLLNGNVAMEPYLEELKEQKTCAERRVAALEQTFSTYQNEHPDVAHHMQEEADAREKLSDVLLQLEKYQKIYGDLSSSSPEIVQLGEQLRRKENELEKLRLADAQHSEAEKSLYAELDKLSTAWETLERQLTSKVYDLASLEERLSKSGIDRAKSENKYFAAMRDKEAIENERKHLNRNIEKQVKAIDRLVDAEKNLNDQMAAMEKEISVLKRVNESLNEKLDQKEKESIELATRHEAENHRVAQLQIIVNNRETELSTKLATVRRMEDSLIKARKDLERQASQKDAELHVSKQSVSDSEASNLMAILKCSTCRTNFRSVIITKCLHTFCKPCVDARITTRQRKCPACNLTFAQSDVQTIYFQ